jgi:hypothetical protein
MDSAKVIHPIINAKVNGEDRKLVVHSGKLCPTNNDGKNWEPSAYNPELGLLYIPSIEGRAATTSDWSSSKIWWVKAARLSRVSGSQGEPPGHRIRGSPQDTGSPLRQPQGHRSDDRRDEGRP